MTSSLQMRIWAHRGQLTCHAARKWGSWDLNPGPSDTQLSPQYSPGWEVGGENPPRGSQGPVWTAPCSLSLCFFQTHHLCLISSNTPTSFQPQGLCTCCSFCLGCSSSTLFTWFTLLTHLVSSGTSLHSSIDPNTAIECLLMPGKH